MLGLIAIAADMHHYRRMQREGASRSRCLFFIAWAALTDSLPIAAALAGIALRDNPTAYILWAMWMFWAWMVTVFPRICYFFFNALRRPKTGLVLGAAVAIVLVCGATEGRSSLRVEKTEICSDRLPAGFDGLRIVQLSDIHIGALLRPEKELRRLVDTVNALRPDLVIFTGDLVNIRSSELNGTSMPQLARFRAPVYSVTGNHDMGTYIEDTVAMPPAESLAQVIERQQQMGWHVLQDTTLFLRRGGDSITLSGISFDPALQLMRHASGLRSDKMEAAYRNVPDSVFNITAVHLPQLWDQITESGHGDLTLAGHTHSMQMKIRFFGWQWSPAVWMYSRWSGRYDRPGSTLYINDGIGSVGYPMRIGARPEITLITLRRCS